MKKTLFLILSLGALISQPILRAAQTNEESGLIDTLKSASATPLAKTQACARLERIGTERCVPAVAALLTDEKLSLSARFALESMPTPKAGKALLHALPQTSGLLRLGIINSLAVRHETGAVGPLGELLSSSDEPAAIASAEALGRIGGTKALKLLRAASVKSSGAPHDAEVDGILACANQLLDAGKQKDALKVFSDIYKTEKPDAIRVAAFRGMILSSGKQGIPLATDAIATGDPAIQSAALLLASQLPDPEMTKALADILPKAAIPVQIALVQCLMQRNDPVALPAVENASLSADADVRLWSVKALGNLGDESAVQLLAEKAAKASGAERKGAKESLLELNRGPVTQRMLDLLKKSSPEVESELIAAIGSRGDQSAIPTMFDLSQNGNDAERAASMQALGSLADATQIPRLVQMVVEARSDDSRSDAADALNSVCQRVQTPDGNFHVDALLKAVESGSIENRLALLPICSGLTHKQVRATLRAAQTDSDARIREAAIHAFCDTRDPELLPDLVTMACAKDESKTRELAIRGAVRLTTQEENVRFTNDKKLETMKLILDTPLSASEKRAVLSGLGTIENLQSLDIATKMLDDEAVQPEAEQSIIKISNSIANIHGAKVRPLLKRVIAMAKDDETKKSAQQVLDKIR